MVSEGISGPLPVRPPPSQASGASIVPRPPKVEIHAGQDAVPSKAGRPEWRPLGGNWELASKTPDFPYLNPLAEEKLGRRFDALA